MIKNFKISSRVLRFADLVVSRDKKYEKYITFAITTQASCDSH